MMLGEQLANTWKIADLCKTSLTSSLVLHFDWLPRQVRERRGSRVSRYRTCRRPSGLRLDTRANDHTAVMQS